MKNRSHPAHVDPFGGRAGAFEVGDRQPYRAVVGSGGGVDGFVQLEAYVEIDGDAFVDAEGANAADRMPDQRFDPLWRDHLRFAGKPHLILGVVDARGALRKDQHRPFALQKRQRLCDHARFAPERFRRLRDRRAAVIGNDDAVGKPFFGQVLLCAFQRHRRSVRGLKAERVVDEDHVDASFVPRVPRDEHLTADRVGRITVNHKTSLIYCINQ